MNNLLIQEIQGSDRILAKVIDLSADETDNPEGAVTRWFTNSQDSLQLGILCHDKGYVVKPHTHGHPVRTITDVTEILIIVAGKYELTIFDEDQTPVWTGSVTEGSIVILLAGGHGLRCEKKGIIIETRQGPHLGTNDKTYY